MIKYSPCYKCVERHELCHSTCEKYKKYKTSNLLSKKSGHNLAEIANYEISAVMRRAKK